MAFEMKEGQVIVFKNNNKTSDNQPDHRGTIMINGKEMDIALWEKEGKNGTFFSGKVSEKRTKSNDDMPF